jgi:hypothetical protein
MQLQHYYIRTLRQFATNRGCSSRSEVHQLPKQHEAQLRPLPSPLPTIDAKESALRIALKDQLRAIKVCQFEGKYDLRAVVTFFEEVELLFQAIVQCKWPGLFWS